jgi:hypothetical protein
MILEGVCEKTVWFSDSTVQQLVVVHNYVMNFKNKDTIAAAFSHRTNCGLDWIRRIAPGGHFISVILSGIDTRLAW